MNSSAKPHRCTLQDIAERTGYTVNTVSRALKNKSDISVATREHIQSVANEMGYIRNRMASSLRSGRTKTLGVIVGGMSNPYYGVMTDAIQNVASEMGYSLLIFCSRDNIELELQMVESAISYQVDGVILFPCNGSERSVERMKAVGIPYVLMARKLDHQVEDCVICDDRKGAYLAARHLIQSGHRKLGFMSSYDVLFSSRERTSGFLQACQEFGVASENANITLCRDADTATAQLLAWRDEGVTGVFFFCDEEAWHAIHLLELHGVRVPEDMAVVGFDNLQGILHFPSPLCTIAYDLHGMASASITLIRQRIHGEDMPPRELIFEPSLVCRGSCGAGLSAPARD